METRSALALESERQESPTMPPRFPMPPCAGAVVSMRVLFATMLLLLASTSSLRASPRFSAPFLSYDVGNDPSSVALADLNADGRPDLAVANAQSATVSILLGNGDGTFGTRTDLAVASHPRSVAIADLDADGRPDLAVAGGVVSVMLGNGDGTFGARTDYG